VCGDATFNRLALQGSPATIARPSTRRGTGQRTSQIGRSRCRSLSRRGGGARDCAERTSCRDRHRPRRTLGVQAPQMMAASDYVVSITWDCVIAELASPRSVWRAQSLLNLRYASFFLSMHAARTAHGARRIGDGGTPTSQRIRWPGRLPDPPPTVEGRPPDPPRHRHRRHYLCTTLNTAAR